MQGVLAVITGVAFNFAPKSWALCNGQVLPIATNQALFALLGTTYGGNGTTTFALPDLRGRTAIGWGQGPGLSNITLGEVGGQTSKTLIINNLAGHAHIGGVIPGSLDCDGAAGSEQAPDGFYIASNTNAFNVNAVAGFHMKDPNYTAVIGIAGNTQPISTMSPYAVINYIICLSGIFPSRD